MVERRNERFFSMPIGCWCGIFVREKAAKKLQKILYRQTQEIKDFLIRNMDELEAENWTIVNMKKQETVYYYDGTSKGELESRISLFDKAYCMRFIQDVFKTDKSYGDARKEVQQFYSENYGADLG